MPQQQIDKPVSQQANVSRMPQWIRQQLGEGAQFGNTRQAVSNNALHTVCEEARCPNRGECWSRGTATFMLLGDVCTRACGFCSVKTGRPPRFDLDEPERIRQAVAELNLRYVVLTSVNRDDLLDGGAGIFAETIDQLWQHDASMGMELLTPDFQQGQQQAIECINTVLQNYPQNRMVWGHNVETVPRLYREARKGSKYERSLRLLKLAAQQPNVETKSAIMLGLGESREELLSVLQDLRNVGVSRLALGQYLRPSLQHLPVKSYIHPTVFNEYAAIARELGFTWVKAGPMVRSSYHAEDNGDDAHG